MELLRKLFWLASLFILVLFVVFAFDLRWRAIAGEIPMWAFVLYGAAGVGYCLFMGWLIDCGDRVRAVRVGELEPPASRRYRPPPRQPPEVVDAVANSEPEQTSGRGPPRRGLPGRQ